MTPLRRLAIFILFHATFVDAGGLSASKAPNCVKARSGNGHFVEVGQASFPEDGNGFKMITVQLIFQVNGGSKVGFDVHPVEGTPGKYSPGSCYEQVGFDQGYKVSGGGPPNAILLKKFEEDKGLVQEVDQLIAERKMLIAERAQKGSLKRSRSSNSDEENKENEENEMKRQKTKQEL